MRKFLKENQQSSSIPSVPPRLCIYFSVFQLIVLVLIWNHLHSTNANKIQWYQIFNSFNSFPNKDICTPNDEFSHLRIYQWRCGLMTISNFLFFPRVTSSAETTLTNFWSTPDRFVWYAGLKYDSICAVQKISSGVTPGRLSSSRQLTLHFWPPYKFMLITLSGLQNPWGESQPLKSFSVFRRILMPASDCMICFSVMTVTLSD